MDALVICIGNKARGDDGAARRTADLLEGMLPDSVDLVSRPHLDVVLAADVALAPFVVFVDAERRAAPSVDVREVPRDDVGLGTHGATPGALLSLAEALYGAAPRAVLVTVAGPAMDHREGLSETAEAASAEAASVVRGLVTEATGA